MYCTARPVRCASQRTLKLTCHKQFSASMWTSEEAAQIRSIAKSVNPEIKTMAIPQGLHIEGGPDAIVEYLRKQVPLLLDG